VANSPAPGSRLSPPRTSSGLAGYVLSLALLLPLAIVLFLVTQIPGTSLAQPGSSAGGNTPITAKRPVGLNQPPPPTLAVPTATPQPTATPVPPTPEPSPTAVPEKNRTYTVQSGDELKYIAAQYNVSIFGIINNNNIPNPDSLKVGQTLKIPDS